MCENVSETNYEEHAFKLLFYGKICFDYIELNFQGIIIDFLTSECIVIFSVFLIVCDLFCVSYNYFSLNLFMLSK